MSSILEHHDFYVQKITLSTCTITIRMCRKAWFLCVANKDVVCSSARFLCRTSFVYACRTLVFVCRRTRLLVQNDQEQNDFVYAESMTPLFENPHIFVYRTDLKRLRIADSVMMQQNPCGTATTHTAIDVWWHLSLKQHYATHQEPNKTSHATQLPTIGPNRQQNQLTQARNTHINFEYGKIVRCGVFLLI